MEEYLRIGVVTSPHGVHGEVNVYPTTDDMNRFKEAGSVFVETKRGRFPMDVEGVKYFKGMAILKLSGIGSMDEAETYRQADILIHRSQSPEVPGKHLVCDLIGLLVYREDGSFLGKISDVLFGGANSVFSVLRDDGKEVLLPNVPACIKKVDIENGRVDAFIIPGLED